MIHDEIASRMDPSRADGLANRGYPAQPTMPVEIVVSSKADDAEKGPHRGEPTKRLDAPRVELREEDLASLRAVCSQVATDQQLLSQASRDWWPISIAWALRGEVPSTPGVLAVPTSAAEVSAILACCSSRHLPVTPVAGRSGVCGGAVPVFGGLALDMTAMAGIEDLDHDSLVAKVAPGTFGPDLEAALQAEGLSLGHWPQSMDISTLGGWVACRSAGQYSTRYGKIEDMVLGLEVALADGRLLRTGAAAPRAAVGPDLTELFLGSEGTLGVVTSAWLQVHRIPPAEDRRAFVFDGFARGLEACRRILQRGGRPAVLRLYDETESARHFPGQPGAVLVVLDEADEELLSATMRIVDEECRRSDGKPADEELVAEWLSKRNDVSALGPLYEAGVVVDTVEVAARWSVLEDLYRACVDALLGLEGTLVASAHQSHAYADGACLYFTFAGRNPGPADRDPSDDEWTEQYYVEAWERVMDAVISRSGAISHHHGIGLNRARFMRPALGEAFGVLASLKSALDPQGILNPGKLGLPSPFGEVPWP